MSRTIGIYVSCLQKRIEYLQSKQRTTCVEKDKSDVEMYTLEIVIEDLQELGKIHRFSYWKKEEK